MLRLPSRFFRALFGGLRFGLDLLSLYLSALLSNCRQRFACPCGMASPSQTGWSTCNAAAACPSMAWKNEGGYVLHTSQIQQEFEESVSSVTILSFDCLHSWIRLQRLKPIQIPALDRHAVPFETLESYFQFWPTQNPKLSACSSTDEIRQLFSCCILASSPRKVSAWIALSQDQELARRDVNLEQYLINPGKRIKNDQFCVSCSVWAILGTYVTPGRSNKCVVSLLCCRFEVTFQNHHCQFEVKFQATAMPKKTASLEESTMYAAYY